MQVGSIRRLKKRLWTGLRDDTQRRTESSAVVFAPHQDDETLGCGGTMILKSERRTPLACVFMTDGSTSHSGLIDRRELCALRKSEALDATRVLGLTDGQVVFLDFPDSRLGAHHAAAVTRVIALLDRLAPEEVYVPYRRDGTADHEATYRIVVDALARVGRTTRLLEYPVWFWNRWPWVPFKLKTGRTMLTSLGEVAGAHFGFELLREFRTGICVRPAMDRKRMALAQHRTQMTQLVSGQSWPTLADISDGEFLNCFFQDFEVFRCSEIAPR